MAEGTRRPRKKRDGGGEEAPAAAGGGSKMVIIAAVVAALLGGVGVGVGFFLGGMLSDKEAPAADSADADGGGGAASEERYNIYGSVGKLLANIDDDGAVRYIQAEIDFVSYEKDVIDDAQHDMPAIRNRLLVLFSSQKYEEVRTVEGREALRMASIDAINEVLGTTVKNGVHDVFFTAFIIQ